MKSEPDRHTREATKENAFDGTYFKVTDIVTKIIFRTFKGENDINPVYNYKKKSQTSDLEKFNNNRQNFNS
jgi:hypothetical protein